MNKTLKKTGSFLLILIATIVVLYCALKDNYEEIIHQVLTINKFYLTIAFVLIILYWILKAIVMKLTVSKFKDNYSFAKALRLIIETNFFHAITPFSSGGQPYEIY